jgi:hypothetical protein
MSVYQHLDLTIGSSILADDRILYGGKDPALESSWHWTLKTQDLNPKFLEIVNNKLLRVIHVEVFKTNFFHPTWAIHIDADNGLGDVPKINWVYGNQECPMIWYKEKDPTHRTEQKITATGTGYYTFDADTVEEIDRTFIKTPTIIQSGIPHTVINQSGKTRWCVSIVLKKEDELLTFDQLVKEFSDYAV